MKCPRCGRENRRDAVVCWKCRASLVPVHEPSLHTRRITRRERVSRKIPFGRIAVILAGIIVLFSAIGAAVFFIPRLISTDTEVTPTPSPEPTSSEGEIKEGEIFLKIAVEAQTDKFVMTGTTNLPEGTEIMLTLLDSAGNEKVKKKLVVVKGAFTHTFGPFFQVYYPGKYKITAQQYKGDLVATTEVFFKGNVEPYQVPSSQGAIVYREIGIAEGLKLAKTQDKQLLIFFVDYAVTAIIEGRTQNPSRYMEQTAFADPEVRGIVNNYFIVMRVDASKDKTLAQSYEVTVFPSIRIFDGEGVLLGSINGVNSPDALKRKLLALVQSPLIS